MFLMIKMTETLFLTPNYKHYHKPQEAGFWTKYRGNILQRQILQTILVLAPEWLGGLSAGL